MGGLYIYFFLFDIKVADYMYIFLVALAQEIRSSEQMSVRDGGDQLKYRVVENTALFVSKGASKNDKEM